MPCSIAHFPNIGTTHCYTAAGTFKSSNAPEIIYTGFARGCINCTGFNSYCLSFLISINSWLVQIVEFVKKSWNLPSNIDISSGKTAFFSQLQQVPYKWIFFVGQILYNLARMFAAHYESSWSPIWLPWVWKKKSLFWKKSLGKVLNFGSKNLYGPYKQNKQLVWSLFKDLSQLTPNEAGFFLKAWGRPE